MDLGIHFVYDAANRRLARVVVVQLFHETSMFSQTVEYALRAMVHLADRAGAYCTTDQISAATHVPKPYLSKVLLVLNRAGLIHSRRGVGGGTALTGDPASVTAVEPLKRIRNCPLGLTTHGARLCPLHRRLDHAIASVEQAFGATTLAELLAEPTSSKPLCERPPRKRAKA